MKTTLLLAASVIGLAAPAMAASYTVTNSSGGTLTQSVVDASGNFFSGGVALFGYYTSDRDAAITSSTTTAGILQSFVLVGSGAINPTTGATPIQGVFSAAGNADITTAGAAGGRAIYVLLGNASTFEASTQVAVLKMSSSFATSEPATATISLRNTASPTDEPGTMLFGGHNLFSGDPTPTSTGGAAQPFYSLAAIPEPSTALLGAIGALGLLRRRR